MSGQSPWRGSKKRFAAFRAYRGGRLAKSSLAVMFWSGARLGSQLVWVLLLARALGASSYGLFSGAAALALAMSGFVGLGLGLRMYQDVARDPALLAERWHQASQMLALTGCMLATLYIVMAHSMFETASWSLLMAIALSELVLAPVVAQVAFGYASYGWMGYAAAAPVLLSLARVLAVFALYLFPRDADISAYAWLHAISTALASGALLWSCRRKLGIADASAALGRSDIRSGLGFSAIQASGLALGTLDKTFALRWGGDALAGHYVAACRFVNVATLPVDSLMMAVLPHLFRAGTRQAGSGRVLIILAVAAGGYGILMGLLVWWGVGLVPWLLGPSFAEAALAAQMLAVYVPLYCARTLGTNVLLGFGWKRWRFFCEMVALSAMFCIARWRIPAFGLRGAVDALLVAEMVLASLVWCGVFLGLARRVQERG